VLLAALPASPRSLRSTPATSRLSAPRARQQSVHNTTATFNTIHYSSPNFELHKLATSKSLAGPSLMDRVEGKSPKVIVGLIRMFLSVFRHHLSYLAESRANRNFRT
jgi:hypothetical protein